MTQQKLPVTILSGFLGAGKTSLLTHLLQEATQKRIAVLVNDMSEISIDAEWIREGSASKLIAGETLVELANGCICCTLREDFVDQVTGLAQSNRFDHLLVESTGISEPLPVAAAFELDHPGRTPLSEIARIQALITVVDTSVFLRELHDSDSLARRGMEAYEGDDRTIADLLIDQVETADLLVLNKRDLVTPDQIQQVEALLRRLNPNVQQVVTKQGRISADLALGAMQFDMKRAMASPGWVAALRGDGMPETEEYGIGSLLWEGDGYLDPVRFHGLLHTEMWARVVRSKGFLVLVSRPDSLAHWSQAGQSGVLERWKGRSVNGVSPRQQLVVIGQELDRAGLKRELDLCLVREIASIDPTRSEDPFPVW